MMLRRIDKDQPETFTFTKSNLSWAKKQISKYRNFGGAGHYGIVDQRGRTHSAQQC